MNRESFRPDTSPQPPGNKPTKTSGGILKSVERLLPRGSKRVIAALGLAASELITNQVDDSFLQAADSLGDAQERIDEERKEQLKKQLHLDQKSSEKRVEELRNRIKGLS